MTTPTSIPTDQLPASIRGYLDAHEARDADTALRAFTSTAVVVDEGITYRGTDEVRSFLTKAGNGYTYTGTLAAAERTDDEHWVAVVKPGRVMFELAGVDEPLAKEALRLAGRKLPIRTKFVTREGEL